MGLLIEALVAALLAVTIGYCVVLNRRLKSLRADEAAMRQSVGALLDASRTAAEAVSGLKRTVGETEAALASRIAEAKALSQTLDEVVGDGHEVVRRLKLIVQASRPHLGDPDDTGRASVGSAAAETGARLAEYRRDLRGEAA